MSICGIYITVHVVLDPVSAPSRPRLAIVFCWASLIALQRDCLMCAAFSRHRGQVPPDAVMMPLLGQPGPLSRLSPHPDVTCDQEPAFSLHAPGLACASKGQCSLWPTDVPCIPNPAYEGDSATKGAGDQSETGGLMPVRPTLTTGGDQS